MEFINKINTEKKTLPQKSKLIIFIDNHAKISTYNGERYRLNNPTLPRIKLIVIKMSAKNAVNNIALPHFIVLDKCLFPKTNNNKNTIKEIRKNRISKNIISCANEVAAIPLFKHSFFA